MSDHPTRRDLMKPVQLLGLAFLAAAFAFVVTLVSMGFFQSRFPDQSQKALVIAGVVAGITFIATLLIIALLILAVDPAQVAKQVDRPVLLPSEEDGAATDAAPGGSAESGSAESGKPAADESPAS